MHIPLALHFATDVSAGRRLLGRKDGATASIGVANAVIMEPSTVILTGGDMRPVLSGVTLLLRFPLSCTPVA